MSDEETPERLRVIIGGKPWEEEDDDEDDDEDDEPAYPMGTPIESFYKHLSKSIDDPGAAQKCREMLRNNDALALHYLSLSVRVSHQCFCRAIKDVARAQRIPVFPNLQEHLRFTVFLAMCVNFSLIVLHFWSTLTVGVDVMSPNLLEASLLFLVASPLIMVTVFK